MSRHSPASLHHHSPGHGHDTTKEREIRFHDTPPGQLTQALHLLGGLEGLTVRPASVPNTLIARYDLADYTLEGLETGLSEQGFHLDNSLYCKLMRAIIYFCEETQLRNLRSPERLIKKSNEIYVKAYGHHPHGDRDEMPPELREYK